MAKKFTSAQWAKINTFLDAMTPARAEKDFGLPRRRRKSVVLGTFNIRKFGKVKGRSTQARNFIEKICRRFDLLAVQEVQDNLEAIQELKSRLGNTYGLLVSDTTGKLPGGKGSAERLAFLFKWRRIERTELASDITYDRSEVIRTLAGEHTKWSRHLKQVQRLFATKSRKAPPAQPSFLTFIRQPSCASFRVKAIGNAKPYEFLVINAHLLFGNHKSEREQEFLSLISWLTRRAKMAGKLYHKNMLMMGDCNVEFDNAAQKRKEIEEVLKKLNATVLKSNKAAKVNFPLLTDHPVAARNPLRTNARQTETFDQIAIFLHDKRLPDHTANATAASGGPDAYDYNIFKFTDLFAEALHGKAFDALTAAQRKSIIERTEHDVSDHMPAWFRLPLPS
jgi:endonuclease/exonuclease/phosphatase family metal-dependent hydrolase